MRAVRLQTQAPARLYGLADRGVLAPGFRADFNVIDYDALSVGRPYVAHDLPSTGRRILQKASGYDVTACAGVVTYERGEWTGALPGRVVRGGRSH